MIKFLFISLLFPVICHAQSTGILDVKNGFLQFHLGDSISIYKEVVNKPEKKSPTHYHVKGKAFGKLGRYIDDITLITENNIVVEIDIYLLKSGNSEYMETVMKKAYGEGQVIDIDDSITPGAHKSDYIWEGNRVVAILKKTRAVVESGGMRFETTVENIIFKKTASKIEVKGELPADFLL